MKIINKILDKYYSYKLAQIITDEIKFHSFVDVRTEETELSMCVKVKEQKFNDNQYEIIFGFLKERAFEYLLTTEEVKKQVSKNLERYLKDVREWKL